jgi:hypothetical protein
VDTVRDLSRVEPWRESLERSLARRREPQRSSVVKRSRMLVVSASGVLALALLVATVTSVLDSRGAEASPTPAHPAAFQVPAAPQPDHRKQAWLGFTGSGAAKCPMVADSTGYLNPLARARVTPERIDQGVDYAGSGTLTSIGAASITHLATTDTGWPGAFIEYQLTSGPDAGCYVYYAEGVRPAPGLRVGQTVRAGQAIATIIPGYSTGIEVGWGAGDTTKTYAAKRGQWSSTNDQDNIPSAPGRSFSALIAATGGPPGKVEG